MACIVREWRDSSGSNMSLFWCDGVYKDPAGERLLYIPRIFSLGLAAVCNNGCVRDLVKVRIVLRLK